MVRLLCQKVLQESILRTLKMKFEIFFLAYSMVSAQQVQQGQPPQEGQPTFHGQPQMQGQSPLQEQSLIQGQPSMQGQSKQKFEGNPQQYQPQPGKYFY